MLVDETEAPTVPGRQLAWVFIAWTLVAGCLVLLATMLVAGGRDTPYSDLRAAVADGRVDEIRVAGGLDREYGYRGFALAEVHWREGLVPRVSTVYEVSAGERVDGAGSDVTRVRGRVDERLSALDPDLKTSRSGGLAPAVTQGWYLPGWTTPVGVALLLGTLALIIAGPQPRRATRWAWFWLLWLAPPLGALVFLLLGGSTGSLSPKKGEKRLTGGWAFLLSIVVGAALSAAGAAVL
jgi:hypothetical protein